MLIDGGFRPFLEKTGDAAALNSFHIGRRSPDTEVVAGPDSRLRRLEGRDASTSGTLVSERLLR